MTAITLDEKQLKALLKQAIIELFQERQDLLSETLAETLEEIGLVNAIREGRKDDFVSEEEIRAILTG
ncbi:MAG: hypothetical protein ACYC6R_16420 [Anaerolineales bacterium]